MVAEKKSISHDPSRLHRRRVPTRSGLAGGIGVRPHDRSGHFPHGRTRTVLPLGSNSGPVQPYQTGPGRFPDATDDPPILPRRQTRFGYPPLPRNSAASSPRYCAGGPKALTGTGQRDRSGHLAESGTRVEGAGKCGIRSIGTESSRRQPLPPYLSRSTAVAGSNGKARPRRSEQRFQVDRFWTVGMQQARRSAPVDLIQGNTDPIDGHPLEIPRCVLPPFAGLQAIDQL